MRPKDKDENAKNPDWKTPMAMPGVKPGTYDASMGASGATDPQMLEASRQGKMLSASTGKVSPKVRKLAKQKGISG